jgi:hypothetical protein
VTLYVSLATAALFAIGVSVLFAVALGRAAAHEDALLEGEARRLLAQRPLTAPIPRPRPAGPLHGDRFQMERLQSIHGSARPAKPR